MLHFRYHSSLLPWLSGIKALRRRIPLRLLGSHFHHFTPLTSYIVLDFFWPPIIYVWRPLDNKNKNNFNTYSFFSGCQFKNAIIAVLFFNETSFICHSFIWKGLNFSPQLKKKNNRTQLLKIMKSICCRDRLVLPTHYLQLRLLRKRKIQSHHTVSLTSSTRAAICLLLSNVR